MTIVKKEVERIKQQDTLARLALFNKAVAQSVEEQGVSL
jgi:hypothetical protein